jgi:hypothetical protein
MFGAVPETTYATIQQRLRTQVLPFIISAERLKYYPPYLAFNIYAYLQALLAAIVGAGLSAPVLNFFNGILSPEKGTAAATGKSAVQIAEIPPSLTWTAIVLAVVLIAARTYFTRADLERKWVLAESCRKEFSKLNTELVAALLSGGNVEGQVETKRTAVATIYQRHNAEGSWPYAITEPGIEPQVETRLQFMMKQLEANPNAAQPQIQQQG